MEFFVHAILYTLTLFAGLAVCVKIGHNLGRKRRPLEKDGNGNVLDGAVFALLGLLLAFTFSSSIESYNTHRNLLTKEANDVAQAHAKLDLLDAADSQPIRTMMRHYAIARLEATRAAVNSEEERSALERSRELQQRIWKDVVTAVKDSANPSVTSQILDAFTAMDDAPADQLAHERSYMPKIIYVLIFGISLMSALLAGYGMSGRTHMPLIRILVFSASIAATMYVIIDLEYPRSGFFTAPSSNRTLAEVIESMR